jgi:hypothetical protein
MRRVILIGAVVAVIVSGCGEEDGAPTPTPLVLATVSPAASASPGATGLTPSATSSGAQSPSASGQPGATATRDAKAVDCEKEPNFCSKSVSMTVSGSKVASVPQEKVESGGSSTLKITMVSRAEAPGGDQSGLGDDLNKIHVEVTVANDTDRTFVFAKRDVSLLVGRDGSKYEELSTTGEAFDMTPGSKMFAKFDVPINDDGRFRWIARTWFYPKP